MHTNELETLAPGDILRRPKTFRDHWGVYLRNGQVLDITPKFNIRTINVVAFAAGRKLTVHKPKDSDREAIFRRASEIAASNIKYSWTTRNCEHLKNYVLTGQWRSETITIGSIAILTGLATFSLVRATR